MLVAAAAAAACSSTTTNVVGPNGSKCEIAVANNTPELVAAGGSGNVSISTSRDCVWTASAESAWISLGAKSGQGAARLDYSVEPNPSGAPRRGRIVVSDQGIDVNQAAAPCRYQVSPSTVDVTSSGGQVSVNLTTLDGCRWTSRSDSGWIGSLAPPEGVGSAAIRFAVAPSTAGARAGTVTIGDAAVRVNQSAPELPPPAPPAPPAPPPPPPPPPTCSYQLTPAAQSVGPGAAELTFEVTAPSSCSWTATSGFPWITVASGPSGSGNGSVRLAIAANSGEARSGAVQVATQTFTVQQAGRTCTYAIKPISYDAGRGPDDISINVTADAGCTWTTAGDPPWVNVASGRTGSGNGTVRLLIPANTGPARLARLTIATHAFTLTQASGCTYAIKPDSYHSGRGPDDIRITVTADPGCPWTASSSVSWASVAEGSSGTGNGTVRVLVERNSGAERTTTLTVAGLPFSLRQNGDNDK
jgi:hypothetical protein